VARGAGDPRAVRAAPPIGWSARVPGSKSLTNRALVLAAMAPGVTVLEGALRSADTDALAAALTALGAAVDPVEPRAGDPVQRGGFRVAGVGGAFPGGADVRVDLGDGGTPTRFMLAVAAFARRRVIVDGSPRMRERPVADGVRLLQDLGVSASWAGEPGRLPVLVDGCAGPPAGGVLRVGALASSQFVSALLLLAPWMREGLEVRFDEAPVSRSYVDLTVEELRRRGARVDELAGADGRMRSVRVAPGAPVARPVHPIEPDASSALYWAGAAALVPGSDVLLEGLSAASRQPDVLAIERLGTQGADVLDAGGALRVRCRACAGDPSPPLAGIRADLGLCPDGALMLIAAAAAADGPSRFEGLGTLRVKESDRLAAMAEGLGQVGAAARIGASWIEVDPIPAGHAVDALIDPHSDHRVAMSFAILGLRTGGIRIADPGCVAKSYPGFWHALERCERGRG
jgi:3-phosphoshikimate 1-carboxyvinyltransferase